MRRTLVAFALVMGVLWPGVAHAEVRATGQVTPRATGQTAAQGPAQASARPNGRVALIGVPGLQWSDLSPQDTPNLWRLAGQSAVGSLSVRTVGRVTCPYDGWLTVSAGVRSAVGHGCGLPPEPVPGAEGAVVPDHEYLRQAAKNAGALGEAVHAAGQCTLAVGPGAALALADRSGKVDRYAPSPDRLPAGALTACRVIAVDVDDLIRPYVTGGRLPDVEESLTPRQRAVAAQLVDVKVAAVLAALPQDASVLLAGLGDHGSAPHLRVAMMRAEGLAGRSLGAASTHREDVTILPDITATMLDVAGVATPPTVIGVPWRAGDSRTGDVERARTELADADVAGQTIRDMGGIFFTAVAVLQVLFYVVAFLLMRRRRGLGGVRVAALALASLPVSTYLVNLTPWHHSGAPLLALVGGILAIAFLLAATALGGPWRRAPLGPLAVVAGVTAAVLAGDLLTGTTLQLNSVMGYTAVVGARYYGLGNIPFALFATSVLLLATTIAHRLTGLGRRGAAVAVVAVLGGVAMILGGWPGVGSDFGGVIAFVPGIAVTALLIAGRRVSIVKLGGFCAAGGVVVMGIAYLDYLRPPGSQTHLGRFVGQVFTGEATEVIGRKLGAMLGTLLNPNLMPIVIAAAAFLVYALLHPDTASAGVVPAAFGHSPALRAGLIGALVSGVVGMLVNDSGAAVLSMALALAVPLTLSVGVKALGDGASSYEAGQEPASSSLVSRNS
ncbi:hypothetical protein [Streptosporangium carneum]|uniref:Uncharacterized protein n=1 Tax=Streptosporangium carneum TaxID=47481 RepID=A0A9W6MI87_9ACTN|nr:hypothetical protein [Streptosporangium carneum]GLK14698.1 hypothetical protein GCM10017600_81100 [Streptosporangium carneum]